MAKVYYKEQEVANTSNTYSDLTGKPILNGEEIVTSNTSESLMITWYGTQAEYDALATTNQYTMYIIKDADGTTSKIVYNNIEHKPAIGGITLYEDTTYSDLDLMTKTEIESKLVGVFQYKGAVDSTTDLPLAPSTGDVYYVRGVASSVAWNGLTWDNLGATLDLSAYQKIADDTLTTTDKTVPGAINELDSDMDKKQNISDSTLTTTAKQVVPAINELDGEQGDLTTLKTVNKLTLVSAINELVDNGGTKDALPLAGGTMTGIIKTTSADALESANNSSVLRINGGSDSDSGATLSLYGDDAVGAGEFVLTANDGSNSSGLEGTASGTLQWGGIDILTGKEYDSTTTTPLDTTDKTVIGAINELYKDKQDKEDDDLETTDKTVIGAINELFANKQDREDNDLETTDKTIVGAINELKNSGAKAYSSLLSGTDSVICELSVPTETSNVVTIRATAFRDLDYFDFIMYFKMDNGDIKVIQKSTDSSLVTIRATQNESGSGNIIISGASDTGFGVQFIAVTDSVGRTQSDIITTWNDIATGTAGTTEIFSKVL